MAFDFETFKKGAVSKEGPTNQVFDFETFKKEGSVSPVEKKTALTRLETTGKVLGSVFGGEKIGEALGQYAARFTPGGRALKRVDPILAKKALQVTVSPKEVVGDVAQVGLTLGTLAGGGLAGGLARKAITSAGIGAGFGVAGAMKRDEKLPEIAKSALTGGVIGGAIPIAGKALSKVGEVLTVKTPRQFVNYALKVPSKQVPKELNEAFLKRKLGGKSLEEIGRLTSKEANQLDDQIGSILSNSKEKFNTSQLLKSITSEARKKGAKVSVAELKGRISSVIPDHAYLVSKNFLTAKEANQLRMAIDKNLRAETAFGPFARQMSNEQKLVKSFDTVLRNSIKDRTGTRALFDLQSESIGLSKLAEQASAKVGTQGRPGLLDIAGAGVGGTIGGIPGAAVGVLIERMLRSPRLLGGIAQALRAGQNLQSVLSKATPVQRTAVFRIVQELQGQ